jgi:dTDP-4-amino-4,6-dideoxygalactose transaminase
MTLLKSTASSMERTVVKEFAFLKSAQNLEQLFARGISLPKSGGLVVPFSKVHVGSDLARKIAKSAGFVAESCFEEPSSAFFLVHDRTSAVRGWFSLRFSGEQMIIDEFGGNSDGEEMIEAVRQTIRWCEETLWSQSVLAPADKLSAFFGDSVRELPVAADDVDVEPSFVCLKRRAGWKGGEQMILTAGPSVSAREAVYALDAAKYGWNDQWSKYLKAFERSFADYIGVKYALATSSCTGALHLSLAALGIGPGDEVIVPDITWVATGNAVLYVGATPVFADVDPATWCLDPASFRSLITPKTKAVMPVHLYGHPCQMDEILAIAKEHNLAVVEDAAPSIGAEFNGRRTGSFGHFAAFSFQGAKLAVTGEGGMLVTNDEALYQRVYTIWDQGRTPGTFWIGNRGWKYKMANMLAAFGLGQLERNDEMVEAKRRIFGWYEEGLEGVPHLTLNREPAGSRSIYWMSSVLVGEQAPLTRDALIARLKEYKIDSRPVFPAISQYPIWPVRQKPQPNALRIGATGINLPSGVCLSRDEIRYVCNTLRDLLT